MPRAVADTHTVIWYLYDDARLSLATRTWKESSYPHLTGYNAGV
jgi:PIN domain nuclease of toxin-antitoxin system